MIADQTTEIERLETIAGRIRLLSGRLCLDFSNTMEYRGSEHEIDLLVSYKSLVGWCEHAGVIPQDEGSHLLHRADPFEAEAVLDQARILREVIYQLFVACAHEQMIPEQALEAFNAVLKPVLAHRQVKITPDGPGWTWENRNTPQQILWPIVYSAAELLTSGELDRVRQCPGCGWLFLDESRNRNRTWCDMRICGNRAKAQRHYRRQKSQQTNVPDSV